MRAYDTTFMKFIYQNQVIQIPIYQRKYSWGKDQCNQLFDDIVEIGKTQNETHFMGSLVYQSYTTPMLKLIIIDGQQRITALSLLMAALARFLIQNPQYENTIGINANRIVNNYLLNIGETGDDRYELCLTNDDNIVYKKIIDNIISDTELKLNDNEENNRVYGTFEHYSTRINEDNFELIWEGINKLTFVTINLDGESPQAIFESLNSTGKTLEDTDLIRNFLLMDLTPKDQKYIYNTYWRHIEVVFENDESEKFEDFIKSYLNIKYNNSISTKIYEEFKGVKKSFKTTESLVIDVNKYWNYYLKIVFDKEEDKKLKKCFNSLKELPYTIIRPFIMRLYEDYEDEKLGIDEFVEIIDFTESYLFRRSICNLDSQSLKGFYSKMYTNLDDENYLESYKYILNATTGKRSMPDDDDFEKYFKSEDVYHSNIKKYVLLKLTDFERDEITDINKCTIEHIMPQNTNLSKEWQEALGPDWKIIHEKYIDTIGNLTLTASNSKLGDKTFKEKKEMEGVGYDFSNINLNKYFKNIDKWDEEEIIKRSDFLFEQAKKIWKYPEISSQTKQKFDDKTTATTTPQGIPQQKLENDNYKYWRDCRDIIKSNKNKYKHFNPKEPNFSNRYILSIGTQLAYIQLNISFNADEVKSQLYITDNDLFNYLYSQREDIESELNIDLVWESLEQQNSSKISVTETFNLKDDWKWKRSITWQLDAAEELRNTFLKRIKQFRK